jgi:phosphatidylinositol transfer protein SFH5
MKPVFSDVQRFIRYVLPLHGSTSQVLINLPDIRWRVQLMEKTVRLLDYEKFDQMLQVHDYDGVNFMGGRDANQKAAASEATKIFQENYPEFLVCVYMMLCLLSANMSPIQAAKFFINVPTFATWIFWFFKSLLSAKTFAKMSVVGTGKNTVSAALLPIIDKDQLPKRYGGEAEAF